MHPRPDLPREWLLQALDLETAPSRDSHGLALATVAAFEQALRQSCTDLAAEAVPRLEAYAERLRRTHPTLPAVVSRVDRCRAALEQGLEAALEETGRVRAETEAAPAAAVRAAEAVLSPGVRVLAGPGGELLAQVLCAQASACERVTLSEGRPAGLGLGLAARLAEEGVPVRYIADAGWELFAPQGDVAIVEAERVLPDGSIVGAVGTALLARVCAAHRIRVYALAEPARYVAAGSELASFHPERRPPNELLPDPPRGVEVANHATDLTPAELLAGLLPRPTQA